MRFWLAFAALLVSALVTAPVAAAYTTYYGRDAGISTITLKRADGTNVTRVRHGLKTFVIRDRSSIHNFHLFGPGRVDRKTGIAFVGTRTWSPVKLVAGTYVFRCDAHPTTMRKTFVVF